MANLGGFAGGMAAGIQSGQRLNLQREEMQQNAGFRERQMKIQESAEADRQDDRKRQQALRDEMDALQKRTYGDQDIQVGTTDQDDGNGKITTIPTMKRQRILPGQDQLRDANFFIEATAAKLRHTSSDPKELMAAADYARKIKDTDFGKAILGTLAGDPASLEKLAQSQGFDAKSAKMVVDPAKGIFRMDTNKGPVDMKQIALYMGADKAFEALSGATADARGTQTFDQGIRKGESAIKSTDATASLHEAEAGMMPAKSNLLNAQAGAANASAGLARAKAANVGQATKGVADEKVSKQALAEIKMVLEKDPSSMDGKGSNPSMAAFLQGRATELRTNEKLNAAQSVAKARSEWTAVDQAASQWAKGLQSLSPKDRKAKYGSSDIATIKNEAIARKLGVRSSNAAPASRTSNLILNEDD